MRGILISSGVALICSLVGTRLAIGGFTRQGFGQPIRAAGLCVATGLGIFYADWLF